jgi:uncharacterized GH25 family protein
MTMSRRIALFWLGATFLFIGCGGPSVAPVKGRVVFNGEPVKEAQITFSPTTSDAKQLEAGKPGTGFTDADGNFRLSTFKSHDGALVGMHNVLVMIDDTNPAKCKRTKNVTLEVKPGSNEFTIEMDAK